MEVSPNQFTEPMEAKKRVNHAQVGIEIIDRGLEEVANITVASSLEYAVAQGRMTQEEAVLCLAAVQKTHVRLT